MNYKITGGTVLSFQDDRVLTENKTIYVREGRLSFRPFSEEESFETIDASRRLVMPGLVNMHTHVYMTLMRNYADDVPFTEWLFSRVMPVEDRLPVQAAYWTNLLGFMEMIRTGTTSYVDMHMYPGQSALAARDAGMRAFIGRGLVGEDLYGDGYSRFAQALEERDKYESDMIQFILAPHAIYTCSVRHLTQVAEAAEKYKLLKQIHLSESVTEVEDCLKQHGKTPVQLLSDLGFLDKRTILAHCVQMQEDDLELIKASGASIVTNPASNAKLGNGIAPVGQMREKGINVCLGTDGCASNNTLNMFREMSLLSLVHKAATRDCLSLPSDYVIRTATEHAGRALHRPDLGTISEGAVADLIFLDLDAPSLYPNNNLVSSLCYSANGSEVDSVMIGGKFVMKNKDLLTIDAERVYHEVNRIAEEYL